MKRKILSVLLASAMVFSMAACGNQPATGNDGSTPAPQGGNTSAPDAAATAEPTAPPKSEGEMLADQYNGFVETPMNLNGRVIRIASSVNWKWDYIKTADGKDDLEGTKEKDREIIEVLKQIEKDYNCKFEVTGKRKGKDIVKDLVEGKAANDMPYDILDEGVSDTYLDQIFAQGLVMDLNDPAVKDIMKVDSNPWKTESEYGIYNGTQYGINFVTRNSSNDLRNVLLFNTTLAEQYGLGDIYKMAQNGEWTWAKFEEMCNKIKSSMSGSLVAPAGYGQENLLMPMMVASNGANIAERDASGKLKYTMMTDKALAAANKVYEWRQNGLMAIGVKEDSTGIDLQGFIDGKCVFFFDFYGDLQKITQRDSSVALDGNTYKFGLLPCPIGPDGDKCHGVTYSADLQMIVNGIKNPEEVAAVLVAIANRTSKSAKYVYDVETENTLQDEGSVEMLKLMYEDMRVDQSRTFTGIGIKGANQKVLKLEATPAEAFGSIAEETQGIYDGTVTKW